MAGSTGCTTRELHARSTATSTSRWAILRSSVPVASLRVLESSVAMASRAIGCRLTKRGSTYQEGIEVLCGAQRPHRVVMTSPQLSQRAAGVDPVDGPAHREGVAFGVHGLGDASCPVGFARFERQPHAEAPDAHRAELEPERVDLAGGVELLGHLGGGVHRRVHITVPALQRGGHCVARGDQAHQPRRGGGGGRQGQRVEFDLPQFQRPARQQYVSHRELGHGQGGGLVALQGQATGQKGAPADQVGRCTCVN
ncbi:MAG: hypothetical protein JO281_18335 [Pseudonocardiales bacterium]|nr:hypothetical protein [Pseudonocardiales bacterium]